MNRDKDVREVIDIIEYVVNVRRNVYRVSRWSYIIWGGFVVLTGGIYLLTNFWPIWFILFPVADFLETSRTAGITASLIGWGLAVAVEFFGLALSLRYNTVAIGAIAFGIGATVGFVVPFTISGKKDGTVSNSWLGKVVGTTWIILVISTLVAISTTVTLQDIKSIFIWMTMVGTGYMLMGVILNDRGPAVGGLLILAMVVLFAVVGGSPVVLSIVAGLISVGGGIYAGLKN